MEILQKVSKFFSCEKTLMRGMSKNQEISHALHKAKTQLDTSCIDVALSPIDVESIAFLPQLHFMTNDIVFSNLSIIFFKPSAVFGTDPLFKHFNASNFFNAVLYSHHCCKKVAQ